MKKLAILAAAVGLLAAVPVSLEWSHTRGPVVAFDGAQARVGRPMTPVSVAGAARRTTRRAIIYCSAGYAPAGCVWR